MVILLIIVDGFCFQFAKSHETSIFAKMLDFLKRISVLLCMLYVHHTVGNQITDSDDQPPMFDHTSILLYLRPNGSDVDYAIYTCMPGYEMTGPADTVIATFDLSTRKWNLSTTPQCQGISCPLPVSPANGYVTFGDGAAGASGDGTAGGGDNQMYPLGTEGVYACNEGYQLDGGPTTTTCGIDGSWSSAPPHCQEHCPATSNSSTTAYFEDGKCFDVRSTSKTWLEASGTCISLDGSLAVIDTNRTLEFLQNIISNVNDSYTTGHWIGGYRWLEPEKYWWKWHTSGDNISNFFWADTEPTNGEKDTRIILSKQSNWKWAAHQYDTNQDDNNEGIGYVCQFDSSCSEAGMGGNGDARDYNGACYYFQNDGVFKWDDANSIDGDAGKPGCLGVGNGQGFLAEIRDQETQDELAQRGSSRSYWIGAERQLSSYVRTWLWVDGSPVEDTWWGPGEPNSNATCISLFPFSDIYLLNGDDCANSYRFVCQFNNINISIQCGDPGTPYHGTRATNAMTFIPGDEVEFSCNPGYEIVGSSALLCGSDGQWSSSLPLCQARTCNSPPDVANTLIIYQSSMDYTGTIIYQCIEDYYLTGQQYIYCQESGNWTQVKLECRAYESDADCKVKIGWIIATGVLTVLLLIYSIAMTVVYIRSKPTEQPNKEQEGNLHPRPETWSAPEQVNHAYLELQAGNLETFPPNPPEQLQSHALPHAGSHSFANSANTAPSAVAYTNQMVVDQSVRMATASHNDDEYDYVVLPE